MTKKLSHEEVKEIKREDDVGKICSLKAYVFI